VEREAHDSIKLSPVNLLPAELLTEIMRCVLHDEYSPFAKEEVILTFRAVCRRWKGAADCDGQSWASTLCIGPRATSQHVHHWLNKVGNFPVDLYFNDYSSPINSSASIQPEPIVRVQEESVLMNALWAKSNQLRTVTALVYHEGTCNDLLYGLAYPLHPFPALEKVDIRAMFKSPRSRTIEVLPSSVTDEQTPVYEDALYAPRSCTDPTPALLSLRLTGLTKTTLYGQTLLDLLGHPLNLTELSLLRVDASLDTFDSKPCPVDLHHCKKLCINAAISSSKWFGVLGLFNAPNVEELTLTNISHDDLGAILFCTWGKFPNVRVLKVEHLGMQVLDKLVQPWLLARWYEQMPLVEELYADTVHPFYLMITARPVDVNPMLPELYKPTEGVVLLPRLRVAILHGPYLPIQKIVEGRKQMGVPWDSVTFDSVSYALHRA
jgi:hypothetical protein